MIRSFLDAPLPAPGAAQPPPRLLEGQVAVTRQQIGDRHQLVAAAAALERQVVAGDRGQARAHGPVSYHSLDARPSAVGVRTCHPEGQDRELFSHSPRLQNARVIHRQSLMSSVTKCCISTVHLLPFIHDGWSPNFDPDVLRAVGRPSSSRSPVTKRSSSMPAARTILGQCASPGQQCGNGRSPSPARRATITAR